MFIYKLFYVKEKEILQDIIVVQMYEIVNIQMHFQSITWYICMFKMYTWVHLGNFFKNDIYIKFGKNIKMIIMVKVGYFCMKQMMMWYNGVILPFH
jgi:hypothetical protein